MQAPCMYSNELSTNGRRSSASPTDESAYLTALNSSLFGSTSAANSSMWPLQQYRSTAESTLYSPNHAATSTAMGDWKVSLNDMVSSIPGDPRGQSCQKSAKFCMWYHQMVRKLSKPGVSSPTQNTASKCFVASCL